MEKKKIKEIIDSKVIRINKINGSLIDVEVERKKLDSSSSLYVLISGVFFMVGTISGITFILIGILLLFAALVCYLKMMYWDLVMEIEHK